MNLPTLAPDFVWSRPRHGTLALLFQGHELGSAPEEDMVAAWKLATAHGACAGLPPVALLLRPGSYVEWPDGGWELVQFYQDGVLSLRSAIYSWPARVTRDGPRGVPIPFLRAELRIFTAAGQEIERGPYETQAADGG